MAATFHVLPAAAARYSALPYDLLFVRCRELILSTMSIMLAKDLLEILVCPACKTALMYRENPESLKCTQCRRVYAVKDDIPIMLLDEALVEN